MTQQSDQGASRPAQDEAPGASSTSPESGASAIAPSEFHFLRSVPLELAVELGRTSLTIGEVLELAPGEVVQLSKAAGETLDLRVNGILFAQGEAVMVNDRYGIRIRNLVDRDQVLSSLHRGKK